MKKVLNFLNWILIPFILTTVNSGTADTIHTQFNGVQNNVDFDQLAHDPEFDQFTLGEDDFTASFLFGRVAYSVYDSDPNDSFILYPPNVWVLNNIYPGSREPNTIIFSSPASYISVSARGAWSGSGWSPAEAYVKVYDSNNSLIGEYLFQNDVHDSFSLSGQIAKVELFNANSNDSTAVLNEFYAAESQKSDIVGRVFTGYQGWFNCEGDQSPLDIYSNNDAWRHWSGGIAPSTNNQTFELYPYTLDYNDSSLFQTDYKNLYNGNVSRLFSSYSDDVINTHFKWMADYALDGVALQRFGTDLYCDPAWSVCWLKATVDQVALKVKNAAEKYDRLFYVMYDISGMENLAVDFLTHIKSDWDSNVVGQLKLTSSANYAKHQGKIVVGIWGIGFVDNTGTAEQFLDLINWFKAKDCYVIGGVPSDWRTGNRGDTKAGFSDVFKMLDMISPWTVGRYSTDDEVDAYRDDYLFADREYCNTFGVEYQPVLFPGFSWSNWNSGIPNKIPRRGGSLFWRQAYNIATSNINSAYIAMFDEYDEATAIAKSAEDSSMIPSDQYFLTLSADGIFISSDFYLRLANEATKMIKGETPVVMDVPIPYSNSPVFFRSSVEKGYDAIPTWVDSTDITDGGARNVIGWGGAGGPECGVVSGEISDSGTWSIRYSGKDTSETISYQYFKVFDVDIPVSKTTTLSYSIYPQQELGRYVAIDLVTTDGITLRDSGAVDLKGKKIHPSTGHGAVGVWNKIECNIGRWLNGKTIDRILIGYDNPPRSGDFRGYIDNILISNVSSKKLPWIQLLLLDEE